MTRFEIELNAAMNCLYRARKDLKDIEDGHASILDTCRNLDKNLTELESQLETFKDPHELFPGAG